MLLKKRINAFVELGNFLSQFTSKSISKKSTVKNNELFFDAFKMLITRAKESNSWFTEDNVLYAIENWKNLLTKENLEKWLSTYTIPNNANKRIAVIMAGNIPLVGFHDFLTVLISGHTLVAKQSSNDKYFLPLLAKYIEHVAPDFKGKIIFTTKLENFDAVIATGSNNTARYFDYYFGKYPHIIRKNRNAVAVITGKKNKTSRKNRNSYVTRKSRNNIYSCS